MIEIELELKTVGINNQFWKKNINFLRTKKEKEIAKQSHNCMKKIEFNNNLPFTA